MKLQPNSVELPGWMNEALDKLGVTKKTRTAAVSDAKAATAAVNLDDLPTVAYRDETFRVRFTNQGSAVLYNSYGNEVVVYERCKTIEDVQDALEQGDVVVREAEAEDQATGVTEFDKELQRVSQTRAAENALKQIALEVNEVNRKVTALSEQFYAYSVIPNDEYDLRSQDAEVAHFQETAANTQYLIDREHELDLSKQSDRVKLNYEFLDSLTLNDQPLGKDLIDKIVAGIEEQLDGGELEPLDRAADDEVGYPEGDYAGDEVDFAGDPEGEVDYPEGEVTASAARGLRRAALTEVAREQFFDQVCPVCGRPGLVLDEETEVDEDYAALRCEACDARFFTEVDTGELFCDDDTYRKAVEAGTVSEEGEEEDK